ncbi:CoA pyrophosphatase [Flagellimonas sp. DF-77]|uniref:NUDIX hydrolase n=1 Tax=Flagellimonas algarum TaxID=3230298 RepID=UPI00339B8D47
MKFDEFSKQVLKVKNLPLPGEESHYKMEPEIRKAWREKRSKPSHRPKEAAVMAVCYADSNGFTNLLLILRKTYQGVHSNQIGFPGGKVENEDRDLMHTALRETHEEVGIAPERLTVLKSLTQVYIPPSNFLVQPFLAIAEGPMTFVKQQEEVEALVEVPLVDIMDDTNRIAQQLSTSYAQNISVPAFKLNGYVVWGATAMMLNEIRDLFKKSL